MALTAFRSPQQPQVFSNRRFQLRPFRKLLLLTLTLPQEHRKQLTSWPDAISIGAGGGSSAQRGVACSQRG
jgi:hypothetical protein